MSAGFTGFGGMYYPTGPHPAPATTAGVAGSPSGVTAAPEQSSLGTLILVLLVLATAMFFARRLWPSSWSAARIFSVRHYETIRFVDGPLAGMTAARRTTSGGLPPWQITEQVMRSRSGGGNFTVPYERGLICNDCGHWHYTAGWTGVDQVAVLSAELESWLR